MADPTVFTSEFAGYLPPHIAANYFAETAKISVVQQLARRVPLSVNGESIPVVLSKMTAGWVAEGGTKPSSKGTLSLKSMTPKKIAAISVVSSEVVRANPGGYMDTIRDQIAEAFALAFDGAALHGTSTPFGEYVDQTTKSIELGSSSAAQGGVWADLNNALRLIVSDTSGADRKRLTGWALDSSVEPTLNASVDLNGRPFFAELPPGEDAVSQANPDGVARRGRLMGRPSYMSDGVGTEDLDTVVGYAGDWRQVVWGSVGGITYDVSTQATVTIDGELISLWEKNLVAVRAEAEFGLLINDVASFVRLVNLISS